MITPNVLLSMYLKINISIVIYYSDIFRGLNENDCSAESYKVNYTKSMDIVMKKVALQYHTNKDLLSISPELDPTDSKYGYHSRNIQYESSKHFYSLA